MQKTLIASLLALSVSAFIGAASAATEVPVYDGKTLAQDNLNVGNWGGGSVAESTDLFLFGGHSLKVTTLDPYQGAKITLLAPAALAGTARMFQITLQRGPVTLHYDPQAIPGAVPSGQSPGGRGFGGGYPGGPPGGYPGGPPGGFGGPPGGFGGSYPGPGGGFGGFGGPPGGFGGPNGFGGGGGGRGRRGGFGGRGGRGGGGAPAPLIPLISKLHLQFTLADGRKADVLAPIPTVADTVAGDGWYSVNVPLTDLKFGSGGTQMLQSVTVAGDQFGVLYIGRMQLAPAVAPVVETQKPAQDDNVPADEQGPNSPQFPGGQFQPPQGGGQFDPQQGGRGGRGGRDD